MRGKKKARKEEGSKMKVKIKALYHPLQWMTGQEQQQKQQQH
jgi:hypothetical protein